MLDAQSSFESLDRSEQRNTEKLSEFADKLRTIKLVPNSDFCFIDENGEIIEAVTSQSPEYILHALNKLYTRKYLTIYCNFSNPEYDVTSPYQPDVESSFGMGRFLFTPTGDLIKDIDLLLFKIYGQSLDKLIGKNPDSPNDIVPYTEINEIRSMFTETIHE